MRLEGQKILLDIDDTLLKSSEEIIRQLNHKNSTHKTIDDLIDYQYRSIDKNITQEDITNMYASEEFFNHVNFNDGTIDFIIKYSRIFDIVFISYGTEENLLRKINLLSNMATRCQLNNVFFVTCEIGRANKNEVLLDNVYLAIDNHAGHLSELNAPKKILLKNFQEVDWNETPINDENTYVATSFKDIEDMIDFDLKLKNMGVFLNA